MSENFPPLLKKPLSRVNSLHTNIESILVNEKDFFCFIFFYGWGEGWS